MTEPPPTMESSSEPNPPTDRPNQFGQFPLFLQQIPTLNNYDGALYDDDSTLFVSPEKLDKLEILQAPLEAKPAIMVNGQQVNVHDLLKGDDLYPDPDRSEPPPTNSPKMIDVIYDTGAAITMFPLGDRQAWDNLRPCLHHLKGAMGGASKGGLMIGDYNAIGQLDSDEVVHFLFPESVATPPELGGANLMSDVQFLQAGHQYVSSLESPKLHFRDGGSYTMNVKNGHKLLRLQPISSTAANSMNYRTITAQLSTPYDPPTYINRPEKLTITEMLQAATTRRPNAETPTAFTWHLRMGCAGVKVLKHTHANVNGMMVQKGSWDVLTKMLPCSGCAAGKMRKSHKLKPTDFTELSNMLTETYHKDHDDKRQIPVFPLSRTAATA